MRANQVLKGNKMNDQKLYRDKPLVIIYGATGTGKTKLSVQLAKQFGDGAEIINADAMQVLKYFNYPTSACSLRFQEVLENKEFEIINSYCLALQRLEYCDK